MDDDDDDDVEDIDDDRVLISYNTSLAALQEVLEEVDRPGDYFCAGIHETPMPSLEVEGAGMISFPVPPAQAQAMIAQAAQRAPYGRGDRTLVDEKVRRVWQIPPEKMSLRGKGWERHFSELLVKVAEGLGCEPDNVAAEFYKLLIYDAGGHFAAHRDTEKTAGMFGTLVVTLPSAHAGGDLVIRHSGRETVVSQTGDEPGEVQYTAFYADCEHEVRPVTGGHRVCLVYNLVHKPRTGRPKAPDNLLAVRAAAEVLGEWADTDLEPLKLVYLLDHHYTQAALSFAGLKRVDAARAWVLREAAAQTGCALHLGIVHIEESGWANHHGGYGYSGSSRWDDDDEEEEKEDESEFEIGEVCDGQYYIDEWRDTDDQPVAFGQIPLGAGETLPDGALDGEKPDQSHFSEATGNEGASFERTYLRAAFVLWPVSRFDEVCLSGGLDAAIARLGRLAAEAKPTPAGSGERARVRHFLKLLPQSWPDYDGHSGRLSTLFSELADFGDADLIVAGAKQVPLGKHYDSRQNGALLACAGILGPKRGQELLRTLFSAAAAREPASCLDLWRQWAEELPARSKAAVAVLEILTAEAPKAKPLPSYARLPRYGRESDSSLPEDKEDKDDGAAPLKLSPPLLADFLATASTVAGAGPCLRFLEALSANPGFYKPETLLLPCLEYMARDEAGSPGPDPKVGIQLWSQCANHYLARSAEPPAKPTDWAQSASIPGTARKPLLKELETFVRDPNAQQHRFCANQEPRKEIHQAIEAAGLDMTHVTERQGRPYTLVCTKTRVTYERARRQYESDLADMRRLLALPTAKSPEIKTEADLLRKALRNEKPA
ncbi:MAG: hypothetical protein JWM59_4278 [Verrucomicrobiales bacterium]|nr:hypothetical protein [Verrucomicrobiales bacterium]